ncbi:MAG: 6-hydroxycyclohex-1-ene-1-carbonyl-CoA dehydrogenase [Candidatus Thalassarchaeaceae archaeon]|jgi:6-hydroxycyclohex-1-ene-1-carbonyl-CoA dehydrogenase|nr:6-hydroxycyclohex-1-ene-1-carbonyl-CoA dehydrogenase [Candidatus Thalassarchaeaceae archaeon]MDP7043767.1 6-hydroxycyclohex-1-ene-1-carbonyl-CoA dehydrogenase [Candidatus Thalassarchaeaceae archaeon]
MMEIVVTGWEIFEENTLPRLRNWVIDCSTLEHEEVVVQVAGCGVCHTDLGFLYGGVKTKHELPLVLGHEISGTVIACGENAKQWSGVKVVIPAVLPCGDCEDCRSNRSNVCVNQIMPGNDVDGGFASHIRVPSKWLVPIPDNYQGDIAKLSVVADAISTPWQALLRAEVGEGDVCIIIGCGGVGGYCAQLSNSLGANIICIDVSDEKLSMMDALGFTNLINSTNTEDWQVKKKVKKIAKTNNWSLSGWKIFECSGHVSGQSLGYSLLGPSATLAIVGFTMDKLTIRLSNLMVFDAKAFGNWGCQPELYAELLEKVVGGAVDLESSTELRKLSEIGSIFESGHKGKLNPRVVLVPDQFWEE